MPAQSWVFVWAPAFCSWPGSNFQHIIRTQIGSTKDFWFLLTMHIVQSFKPLYIAKLQILYLIWARYAANVPCYPSTCPDAVCEVLMTSKLDSPTHVQIWDKDVWRRSANKISLLHTLLLTQHLEGAITDVPMLSYIHVWPGTKPPKTNKETLDWFTY